MHIKANTHANQEDMRIQPAGNGLGQDLYDTQVDGRGACCEMSDVTIIDISRMHAASAVPGR